MKYLQSSFTIERPSKVFGCEACIYGETHGYPHTFGEGCDLARMCLACAEPHDPPRNFHCPKRRHPATRGRSLMRMFKGC